jgi:hypothetical protein
MDYFYKITIYLANAFFNLCQSAKSADNFSADCYFCPQITQIFADWF